MTQHNETSLFKQLIQRRVFQIVGIYLGAIVAMMEFTGMVVERYGVSDHWVDLVLAGMVSFIPAVLILAWRHGAPGKDEWGKAEKIVVPLNGLVTLALLFSIASNQPLIEPASSKTQTSSAESLITQHEKQLSIPKRLGILFFDPAPELADKQWYGYGLSYLLAVYLDQHPNITAQSYYSDLDNSFLWQIKRAGFKDGLNVPQSLAHQLAMDFSFDFFTQGHLQKTDTAFMLKMQLFETKTNKAIVTFETEGNDIYQLADAAAVFIKQQQELFTNSETLYSEIPLKDLTTSSIKALKLFINAANQLLFNNNYDQAIAELKLSLDEDPSFALAAMQTAQLLSRAGQLQEAGSLLRQALMYNYKLTERTRFSAKAFIYGIEQKQERQEEVYRNWMEFYPNDYVPKNYLASLMLWNKHDLEQSASLYEESLQLNPSQHHLHSRLAEIYLALGKREFSETHYRHLLTKMPSNYVPLLELGNLELLKGDLNEAEHWYKKASLLRTDKVSPVLALAKLAVREGKVDEAQAYLDEAQLISQAPRQRGSILSYQRNLYTLKGQYQAAFEALKEYQHVGRQYMDPIDGLFATSISFMHLYVYNDKTAEALELLEQVKPQLDPALSDLVEFGYLFLNIALSKPEEAKASLVKIEQLIDRFRLYHLSYLLTVARAWIADIEQNPELAEHYFKQAITDLKTSIHGKNNYDFLWILNADLIRVLRTNHKLDEAESLAHELLKSWPYHPDINLQLAYLYDSKGKPELAVQALEKALIFWNNSDNNHQPSQQARSLMKKLTADDLTNN